MRIAIEDLSVVFLCYDEPERRSFFSALEKRIGKRAVKVEGVKGWDAAHKAAASAAATERFVLVDGDTTVHEEFWSLNFRLPSHMHNDVLSFCSYNPVNGLSYGNGGLKIWTRDFISKMKTHEASDSNLTRFEFCYLPGYQHFMSEWSTTHINLSPKQAYRAGFREAAKISSPDCIFTDHRKLDYSAQRKLFRWCTVGAHASNGKWAIAGARDAVLLIEAGRFPEVAESVNDYALIDQYYESEIELRSRLDETHAEIDGVPYPFSAEESKFIIDYIVKHRSRKNQVVLEPCRYDTE